MPRAKVVAISNWALPIMERAKAIECPFKCRVRPSPAPEWRLVGQENYVAMVAGCFRRNCKTVSSRGELFRGDVANKCSTIGAGQKEKCPVELHTAFRVRVAAYQLTRFQVWPPQNMPPQAQP